MTPMAWPWCRGGVAGARLRAGTGATPASRRPLSSAEIHLPPPQKGKGGGQAGLGGAEDCGLSPAGDLERPSSPQLGTATVIQVPGVDSAPRIQQLSLKTELGKKTAAFEVRVRGQRPLQVGGMQSSFSPQGARPH